MQKLKPESFTTQETWLVVTEVRSESYGLVTERRHNIPVLCAVSHMFAYWTSPVSVMHVIFFIVECGIALFLCAMSVFDVQTSSSSPRLPLCQISFLSYLHCRAPVEKNCVLNQSLNPSQLIWCVETEAFTSEFNIHNRHSAANTKSHCKAWTYETLCIDNLI